MEMPSASPREWFCTLPLSPIQTASLLPVFYSVILHRVNLNKWLNLTAATKSLQSCPTLCNPIDGSPAGSPVPGLLQARALEWVAISFSNAWKWKGKVKSLSRVQLFPTPWTAAHQAPPSMGFSRQEYWSGVPLPSPKPDYSCPSIILDLNTKGRNILTSKWKVHFQIREQTPRDHRRDDFIDWLTSPMDLR